MAESLGMTTLGMYREFRAQCPPEEAIEKLRACLRMARVYAIATERHTHGLELTDEIARLTGWLENVRLRADRTDRHGRYWLTGLFQERLIFTLECHWPDGETARLMTCETAGCAIKHAFGFLQSNQQGWVTIMHNRGGFGVHVSASTSMATLLGVEWPVD